MYHAAGLRRPAGDRARTASEGRRRARRVSRRPLPLLQQGRHARPARSNTTRIRTARSTRSSAAISTTGRERRAVSVQGGSVTPQVVARRQDARLRPPRAAAELRSTSAISRRGRDRAAVSSNVDKDLQEAWAIHGLYPQYAWMPDGKSIVIWGEGKIWRVDVARGKGQPIPFTAHVEQTLNDARAVSSRRSITAEFPVQACCATCASRPTASASSTARSAISTSRRCRRPAEARDAATIAFEFFPSFSRDGQWIVYTTWTDAELRAASASCGPTAPAGATSSRRPGHYVEPSFSPDGKRIVFRHAGGDRRAGRSIGEDAGIYVVPAAGGRAAARARGGADPEFDHTGTRIYVTRRPQREVRAAQRRRAGTGDSPLPGRRRDRARSQRQRDADRAVARRQVGRVRGALQDFRRAVSAHRPSGRHRPGDGGVSACSASRATPASTCTGRATAAASTGRSARSSSRAISATRSRSLDGGTARKPDEPEAKGVPHRLHGEEPTCRRARSRSSARASSRWPASTPVRSRARPA